MASKITVAELSEQITSLTDVVLKQQDRISDIETWSKEIVQTIEAKKSVINTEKKAAYGIFVLGIVVGILFSVLFVCTKNYATSKKTDTTTDTVTIKTNKDTELKNIVKKISASDRQKLSECIETALDSGATEAYELRENLHDEIKVTFDDPEEKIWSPFRQWIIARSPADSLESAKSIYETIQKALQTEVKEQW
jgi:cell division protein FtsL